MKKDAKKYEDEEREKIVKNEERCKEVGRWREKKHWFNPWKLYIFVRIAIYKDVNRLVLGGLEDFN